MYTIIGTCDAIIFCIYILKIKQMFNIDYRIKVISFFRSFCYTLYIKYNEMISVYNNEINKKKKY